MFQTAEGENTLQKRWSIVNDLPNQEHEKRPKGKPFQPQRLVT